MGLGVLAAVLAGAFWGLAFIAPVAAVPYTPFDVTVGRYLAFGLISVVLLARKNFSVLRGLHRRDWLLLAALGFSGNVGYYLAMALAVKWAGTTVVALIIGTLPVIIAILGNTGARRVPTRRLVLPLALLGAGLVAVNAHALSQAHGVGDTGAFVGGLASALVALALWAGYSFVNAAALKKRPHVSSSDWTALTGVGTLLALIPVALIGPALGLSAVPTRGLAGAEAVVLLLWSLALGGLSSWASTWAWSVATRRLPMSLAGQLIVAETVFALVYGALYAGRWPPAIELVGAGLMVAGATVALRLFAASRRDAKSLSDARTTAH